MNPLIQANGRPCLLAMTFLLLASAVESAQSEDISYNRDVRPILSDKCFACHGPDDEDRQADLRLDLRQDAIDAAAIIPGDPNPN